MAEAKPLDTKDLPNAQPAKAPKAPPAQHQPAREHEHEHEREHEQPHEGDHHLARDQLNPASRATEPREHPMTEGGGERTVEKAGADRTGADRTAAGRDRLAAEKALRAQQAARPVGRPTPTAEECDLIAMGLPISKVGHADDGSGPDPYRTRNMTAGRRPVDRGYETR
jgi:hypothetical protein